MQNSDSILIECVLQGDKAAFGSLIEKYKDVIYGLAFHFVKNFADAQDLTQDAFITAYEHLTSLEDKSKFKHWLRRITMNLCIAHLRRQTEPSISLNDISDDEDLLNLPESAKPIQPDQAYERKLLRETLMNALEALPTKSRLAVTLYYIDGLSYQQIADFLNVPKSTVSGRLQMGKKLLKEKMMTMVKDTFQDNKLPQDFTQKTLQQIMAEGKQLLRDGKLEDARAQFRQAITMAPDSAEGYRYLGFSSDHENATMDIAIEAYEKAFELDPKDVVGTRLAHAYVSREMYDKAKEMYDKAVTLYRRLQSHEARNHIALIYYHQGKYDEAEAEFRASLDAEFSDLTDRASLLHNFGWFYCHVGKYDKAIPVLKEAIDLHPEIIWTRYYLAWAYSGKGEIDTALKWFKQAMKETPDAVTAAIRDGEALEPIRQNPEWRFFVEGAVQCLTERLKDEYWGRRMYAVEALGNLGNKTAIPALENAMNDKADLVRKKAQEALKKLQITQKLYQI